MDIQYLEKLSINLNLYLKYMKFHTRIAIVVLSENSTIRTVCFLINSDKEDSTVL